MEMTQQSNKHHHRHDHHHHHHQLQLTAQHQNNGGWMKGLWTASLYAVRFMNIRWVWNHITPLSIIHQHYEINYEQLHTRNTHHACTTVLSFFCLWFRRSECSLGFLAATFPTSPTVHPVRSALLQLYKRLIFSFHVSKVHGGYSI